MPEFLANFATGKAPVSYETKNIYNSRIRPGTVHCRDTAMVWYFQRYLIQKIISVFEWDGLPENWDPDYFAYSVFILGHCEVVKTRSFGIIPQAGALGGFNLYYRPKYTVIANPLLKSSIRADIGVDCSCIHMQPDYFGAWDIVTYYADLMGLASEAAGVNLLNSKLAYVFASGNKAEAETFKKLYDNIASGQPAAFVDRQLFNDDGSPRWMFFNQNLKQTYITNDIFNTLLNLDAHFNTLVGIPNVNITKASGVSESEVDANNTQTQALAAYWLVHLEKGVKQTNDMFGLSLGVKLKFDRKEQENAVIDSRAVQLQTNDI